ncbi:MAG: hypothetical protein ACXW4T_01870 [Candidatus Limnocylindrales bacterium]
MTRPVPRRLAALSVLAVLVAACGATQPSPTPTVSPTASASADPTASPSTAPLPSGAVDRLYDTIEDQVDAIRGLKPTDVKRETIDGEALKAFNARSFDEDNPAAYVKGNERLLKAFGLFPEDKSLKGLFLELIDSQVAGFYRPDDKTLYVVSRSGAINGADKITFAHEYDHALQDANFPVFAEQEELLDETDRAMARAAIYEGDATLLMSVWAGPNLTPEEFQDVLSAGADPESTAILARTPAILVQGLLFPYNVGLAFLQPKQATGGWGAVDAVFADLPRSTEQVLHPDKYEAGEEPVAITLPANLAATMGTGWSETIQDTFGEFQMGVWLRETGASANTANTAAAGWGGDRLVVLHGPNDAWAVAMHTEWDTPADADEFEAAATVASGKAGGPAAVLPGAGGTTRWFVVGSDAATLGRVSGALGLAG